MGKVNHYNYRAKPETVYGPAEINPDLPKGLMADSGLEARMIRLLIEAKVPFKFHVKYNLPTRDGHRTFNYTIDFVFPSPVKFRAVGKWITHLEIKGVLTPWDLERIECLEHRIDCKGFIALPSVVEFWEKFGLDGRRNNGQKPVG